MKNKRLQSAAHNKGPNLTDFISKMPDDVLVMILARIPIKDAVVTGSLSTRWKHLWRNLTRLDFDGTEILEKVAEDEIVCDLEREKYVNQVYDVISCYSHPRVQVFRICFDLDSSYSEYIDEWIQFALDKKVEKLELDLMDKTRDPPEYYDFQLPLSNSMVMEMLFLKYIFLKGVNLDEPTLNNILKNSPHLVKFCMYTSDLFTHVRVGGKDIKLKHIKLVDCSGFESISLYGFDLVSFIYCGPEIQFHLSDLPKLRELDIGEVSVGFENNVFGQISSCALKLRVLVLDIWSAKKGLNVNAIIKFPNVKKLMLVMGAEEDDCLLEYTSIAQACPRLETFSISLHWCSPMKRRRKVKRVAAPRVHKHLKVIEIIGYYGRISDLELAVYAIENAAALKKIIIDPRCHAFEVEYTREEFMKREQDARSTAKRQLTPLLPPGVDLAIV
ncbi:putative F-box domain, FBD domain, F-box-like domain superfamily protein [Helianthus annuus]|nr:putative F-box domain, FBD domain, leucine-rich repeat domain superfamily [Helianthus annuus]KAJ0542057.1 putative F-box domain, FBD domain, leucine-rich repeat domain superfamily [Helianthus annuus]KAJ0887809.1 putative F-box domain, FBD domain, F-box-like domain superfamily protein [Helianthus annuus]